MAKLMAEEQKKEGKIVDKEAVKKIRQQRREKRARQIKKQSQFMIDNVFLR